MAQKSSQPEARIKMNNSGRLSVKFLEKMIIPDGFMERFTQDSKREQSRILQDETSQKSQPVSLVFKRDFDSANNEH